MPRLTIKDFSGGLVTNNSEFDLLDNQYQTFSEVDNTKPGVLKKPKITSDVTTSVSSSYISQGSGYLAYRTEYDNAGTPLQNSTYWHIVGFDDNTSSPFVMRYDGSSWTNIITSSEWTLTNPPSYNFFTHNQVLRISDGNFDNSSNVSKWYGHIKRDIFGQGETYTSSEKFAQPSQASAINSWVMVNTEIVPPNVKSMSTPFDKGDVVTSQNDVGLHIHYPLDDASLGDDKILDDIDGDYDERFFELDRYTVSFMYDYSTETELARNSDGNIGVLAANWTTDMKRRIPCVNLVLSTVLFNKRITGVKLYWKPQYLGGVENVEWFEIQYFDINKAWSESDLSTSASSRELGVDSAKNMGFWIPCPDLANVRTIATNSCKYANIVSGDGDTWVGDPAGVSGNILNLVSQGVVATDIAFAGYDLIVPPAPTTNDIVLKSVISRTDTLMAQVGSVTTTTGTNDTVELEINAITHKGQTDTTPQNGLDGSSARSLVIAPVSTSKVSVWYIPNDGIGINTYSTSTGLAPENELQAIRWNASTVINDRAYYGNVDTKDENEQTVRERSRIYYTPQFQIDHILPGRYFDIGKGDGDSIVKLDDFENKLYIFKNRNIYIYNVSSGGSTQWFPERHFPGVGCVSQGATAKTPYGIVTCDQRQVSLVNTSGMVELSYPIRDAWQGLTLDNSVIGYNGINNSIFIINDTNGTSDVSMYVYDFDNKSWKTQNFDMNQSVGNFQLGENLLPYIAYTDTDNSTKIIKLDAWTSSLSTATIKTKRYDFASPELKKRFTKIYLTFSAASAVTVKLYVNGNSSADKTLTFALQNQKDSAGKLISLTGKSIEIEVSCGAGDFELDDIMLDYDPIGANP